MCRLAAEVQRHPRTNASAIHGGTRTGRGRYTGKPVLSDDEAEEEAAAVKPAAAPAAIRKQETAKATVAHAKAAASPARNDARFTPRRTATVGGNAGKFGSQNVKTQANNTNSKPTYGQNVFGNRASSFGAFGAPRPSAAAQPTAKTKAAIAKLAVGCKVKHKKFGKGTVTEIRGENMTVRFAGGEKKFVAAQVIEAGFIEVL